MPRHLAVLGIAALIAAAHPTLAAPSQSAGIRSEEVAQQGDLPTAELVPPAFWADNQEDDGLIEQIREVLLQNLAQRALLEGMPLAFGRIMGRYVDPAWNDLDPVQTAVAMLSWMPDSARFLPARIAAAEMIAADVDRSEMAHMWRDLRVRAELIDEPAAITALIDGMTRTGFDDLARETAARME